MSEKSCEIRKTSIGGQAIIEGIMMRGVDRTCMAVRNPEGKIQLEDVKDSGLTRKAYKKIPIIRGMINFVASLVLGFKTIERSADIAMGGFSEEEETKFDKWLKKKFGDKADKIINGIIIAFAVILAVGLFILLPFFAVRLLERITGTELNYWFYLIEGVIRIAIFLTYLALIRQMKDMKRLFGYHGAEHKTIHCYEYGEELTVENVRKHSRFHKRCGTNFLLIVMIVSILIFSFIRVDSQILRLVLRLALLPVVAGVSYEIIKLLGRYDNILTKIVAAPGLLLQRLTTNEPTDDQIEVGIAALSHVIPENAGVDDKW